MRSQIPLMFPSTRKALWCHSPLGGPVTLTFPRISLSVSEQVLFLAFGQSRTGKTEHCQLCGDVKVEPDCSEVVLYLDQFVSSSEDDSISNIPGTFQVPTKLHRKPRHEWRSEIEQGAVANAHWELSGRAKSGSRVDLSEFMTAVAECTVFGGTNQIHCDLDVDVMLLGAKFDITPIEAVSVAMTALSKSLLANDKPGIMNSQVKSGYLTMDQYRKVLFLMESDPKVLTVPIIGIWVSGVDLVTDPYIWAACVRYMHTTQISDRVPKPSEPFLLIHKSPLMTAPQFFDCVPASSALNFRLASGTHGFSMAKEVCGVRKGLLSVKLEVQDLSSPRGRNYAELIEQAAIRHEQENRLVHATPKPTKQKLFHDDLNDSMPRSSPSAYKAKGIAMTLSVPEVSMLDESNPLEAPQPTRLALHQVNDQRLNRSPFKQNNQVMYQPEKADHTARKIKFDEGDMANTQKMLQKMLSKAGTPNKPSTPPLRSPHRANTQPTGAKHTTRHAPNTLTTTEALNLSLVADEKSPTVAKLSPFFKGDGSARKQSRKQKQSTTAAHQYQQPTYHSGASGFHGITPQGFPVPYTQMIQHPSQGFPYGHPTNQQSFPDFPSQPYAAVIPRPQVPQQSPPTCQCQCQHRMYQPHAAYGAAPVPPTNPLSVITDNVQRLLSPRSSATRPAASDQQNVQPPSQFGQVNISPIDTIPQMKTPCTPSPLSQTSQVSNNMSPEVQEILRQQDNQLKALQLQIQKLLQAQDRRDQLSTETQTLPSKKCATVNTGVSLLNPGADNQVNCGGMSDTQESLGDSSSQSHSLIQHDLTTLDLPTQVTARSFASDINVDYESFDESPTGSPKRDGSNDSRSDESWQSPVLGESVSMIAESMGQESTKQQLGVIIRNVQDLLAKHTPVKTTSANLSRQQNETTPPAIKPQDLCDSILDQQATGQFASAPTKKPAEAKDVALATRNQLRKFGIDVGTPGNTPSVVADGLPKIQYISMVMTDSSMADSNKSLEMNALALKYLHDDQLTELAQLTVHNKTRDIRHTETSLLRQVLTMSKPPNSTFESSPSEPNMSMATQQYLRRYALNEDSMEATCLSYDDGPALDVTDPMPATNLKSILRKTDHMSPPKSLKQTDENDDCSIQVLDIARLKELPKLL